MPAIAGVKVRIMAAKPTSGGADNGAKRNLRPSPSIWHHARANFLTGLVVVLPVVLTLWLTWTFITLVDEKVVPLVPAPYNPRTYIDADIPGFGVIIFLVFTTIVGYFAKRVFGRQLIRLGEIVFE